MKTFKLEICANSAESAIMAQTGGAHRVELCDNILEGGTTPSIGSIKLARKYLSIDLNVIIRPRGGDFLYSDLEFEMMCTDIEIAKDLGVDGVVFGILLTDGSIDIERTKQLVAIARPMSITFHRAFDVCNDPFKALEDIIHCGCNRILTSGHQNKAMMGLPLIKNLIEKANNRIIIMPGSGIDETNIVEIFRYTGANEFHASLRSKVTSQMTFRNEKVNMGGTNTVSEFEIIVTDPKRVKQTINTLRNIK